MYQRVLKSIQSFVDESKRLRKVRVLPPPDPILTPSGTMKNVEESDWTPFKIVSNLQFCFKSSVFGVCLNSFGVTENFALKAVEK